MATNSRMREKVAEMPQAKVASLIRQYNLEYGDGVWKTPNTIGRIACVYGTNISSIQHLAREGYLSNGNSPGLEGFCTVPNPIFQLWHKTGLPRDVVRQIFAIPDDAMEKAIEHLEVDCADGQRGESGPSSHHDVVVTFKGTAIEPDARLREDPINESIELVLPRVPEIQTIEGIYAVDEFAAETLKRYIDT